MKTEKLYLACNGEEVKVGDLIRGTYSENGINSTIAITVSDDVIPMLKKAGILKVKPEVNSINITQVIDHLAKRIGSNPNKVINCIENTAEFMPMAAVSILLREIAIMLDNKYPDHIEKSDKIYCVSSLDGRIHEVSKGHIKNYRNFAAFRSIEDAKLACSLLRNELKELFKSGKQKD